MRPQPRLRQSLACTAAAVSPRRSRCACMCHTDLPRWLARAPAPVPAPVSASEFRGLPAPPARRIDEPEWLSYAHPSREGIGLLMDEPAGQKSHRGGLAARRLEVIVVKQRRGLLLQIACDLRPSRRLPIVFLCLLRDPRREPLVQVVGQGLHIGFV